MRNLQNQKSIRAKRSTDPKQARQRFLDACKEYHSPTHSGYVCVWGAEIDVCIFIFVCVVFVVVVAWVLFSLFLKGNLCNYTNKTKKFRLRRAINAIVVYIYIYYDGISKVVNHVFWRVFSWTHRYIFYHHETIMISLRFNFFWIEVPQHKCQRFRWITLWAELWLM